MDYLHSDLGMDEKGKPQRHKKELADKLSKIGKVDIQENFINMVTDRVSIYRVDIWKENPEGLKFFDVERNLIACEELEQFRGLLIAEGKQYQLRIEIDDFKLLNSVLNFFNKYSYNYKVNSKGQLSNIKNPDAIYNAWDIPLIIISSEVTLKRSDYRSVIDFTIDDENHEISTLVRKQATHLEEILRDNTLLFTKERRYANRPFIELYMDK